MAKVRGGPDERKEEIEVSCSRRPEANPQRLSYPSSSSRAATVEDDYTNRAFLPIIVQDFRPGDSDWYNFRVVYLNVTSVTTKVVQDGEEFYVCHLDPDIGSPARTSKAARTEDQGRYLIYDPQPVLR